jgi:AcrR family transcriptional regulator
MPTRRKRSTAENRQKQILAAARRLFARQGFRGTTTRHISEAAGVNEAIVFRYFKTKEALYWAVLNEMVHRNNARVELQEIAGKKNGTGRLSSADDEKFFTEVAEGILRRLHAEPQRLRLLLFSALERHTLSQRFFRTFTVVYWDMLAKQIRSRMRDGRFRQISPLIAARSFTGMVAHYAWMQNLFATSDYRQAGNRSVARTLARIWLGGMQARKIAN